jgi:hypothetical protein
MTNSQIETLNFYKNHGTIFNDIESKILLKNGNLKINTKTHTYIMGKRGGIIETKIK